jgi:hypothetical protein
MDGKEVPSRPSEYSARNKWLCVGVLQDDLFLPLSFVTQCTTKILQCLMVRSGIDCFSFWQNLEKYPFPPQKIVSMVFFFLLGDVVLSCFVLCRFISGLK